MEIRASYFKFIIYIKQSQSIQTITKLNLYLISKQLNLRNGRIICLKKLS